MPTLATTTALGLGQEEVDGRARKHHHMIVIAGPAGCGKTTVAEHVSAAIDLPYIEGDSYHMAANIEKMRSGIPLTDADRWDWLITLREESIRRLNKDARTQGVVVTCSAVKLKYRDVIRVAAYHDPGVQVHFIYLDAPADLVLQRVQRRQNHYMGANMVSSQYEILERPLEKERDVVVIDVSRSLDEVKEKALARAQRFMDVDMEEGSEAEQNGRLFR